MSHYEVKYPAVIRNRGDYKVFLASDLAAHNLSKWRFHYRFTRPELLFQRTLRAAEYYKTKVGIGRVTYAFYRIILKHRSLKTGIAISPGSCGPGLSVPHYGSVVVHRDARLGAFCRIHSATNIGTYHGAAPRLGDFVYVGPGAVIYGDVEIGSRSIVGAGTVVGQSVPAESMCVGARSHFVEGKSSLTVMPPWIATIMTQTGPAIDG